MRSWISLLACLAAALAVRSAGATCMAMCSARALSENGAPVSPDPQKGLVLAVGAPLLVDGQCFQSCSAPGGPASGHTFGAADLKVRRGVFESDRKRFEACTSPVAGRFLEEQANQGARYRFDATLPVGRYFVQWGESVVLSISVGEPPPAETCVVPVEAKTPSDAFTTTTWSTPRAAESPEPSRRTVDWEDRERASLEVGLGPWIGAAGGDGRPQGFPGGVAALGLHWLVRRDRGYRNEKFDWPEVEGMRWCLPIMCGGIGLMFAPSGALIGNEYGVDLRVVGARSVGGDRGDLLRVGVRPAFLYSHGRFRTGTFVGMFLPEVGLQFQRDRASALALTWSPYPVDLRLGGAWALAFDPLRVGLAIPTDGARVRADVGAEITLRLAPP